MHVTTEHSERKEITKKSFFFRNEILVQPSAYFIKIVIIFTPAEIAIIDERQLWNSLIRMASHQDLERYIVDLSLRAYHKTKPICPPEGKILRFTTLAGAKAFDEQLRSILQKMKEEIDFNSTTLPPKTYDL